MALVDFKCLSCGQVFQVPGEKIPPGGARGRCKGCGASLMIYPDGRALPVPPAIPVTPPAGPAAPPVPTPPPPPADDPIWSVRTHDIQGNVEEHTSLRLADVRQMIMTDKLMEGDSVKVLDGDWTPGRAFPLLGKLFAARLEQFRHEHGDEEHCAHHHDAMPGWQCLKCQDYLCERCVGNRPLLEGGEERFLCLTCDFETRSIRAKPGISGVFKGFLGKKS